LLYEPSLSETISGSVNDILDLNKPSFLDELRLSTFTLGRYLSIRINPRSEAPRIESIKTYPRTEDDILMMDCMLSFSPFDEDEVSKSAKLTSTRRNSKIVLTAKIGKGIVAVPLPILLKEVGFRGLMRIQIKFSTLFPHIKTLEFGFLEKPQVDSLF
jgi:Ca2+-dependent lipid-binding protein